MSLIDSHAHLTFDGLRNDVQAVLERADRAGVGQIITVGTDVEDSRRAIALADTHADVLATAGIHPHEAAKATDRHLSKLASLLSAPKVVAAGEMGLDYHYDFSDRASQQRVFKAQLELVVNRDLALVVHSREALKDTVEILSAAGFDDRRVVFHCFTGTPDEARSVAEHGWRISFAGVVTFKRSTALQAIARDYPSEMLMLETDSPYLSPVPVRKLKTNEPAHLTHIARFLADLRGETYETLAALTTANVRAFFGIA